MSNQGASMSLAPHMQQTVVQLNPIDGQRDATPASMATVC